MRILGVDPGLKITGYAVIEKRLGKLALIEAGMVRGRTRGDLAARLHEIHDGIRDVIAADLPVFFMHQRDPLALQMAAFPSRNEREFATHWKGILANPHIVKAIDELRKELGRQASFSDITPVRDQLKAFLRSSGKFPEYIDVGDWKNMVKLFVHVARTAQTFRPDNAALKKRVIKRYKRLRHLL